MFADTVADQIVSDSQREWGGPPPTKRYVYLAAHSTRNSAIGCDGARTAAMRNKKNADDPKFKKSHALDAPLPPDATGCNESAAEIRTRDGGFAIRRRPS